MKIIIETIPQSQQRYATVGDWATIRADDGELQEVYIKISESGNLYLNLALAVHELAESVLCADVGITDAEVDKWDLAHLDADDPGSLPNCPYGPYHARAEVVEHAIVGMIGLSWQEYERRLFKGIAECNK